MFSKIFKITLALVFAITVFTSCEKEEMDLCMTEEYVTNKKNAESLSIDSRSLSAGEMFKSFEVEGKILSKIENYTDPKYGITGTLYVVNNNGRTEKWLKTDAKTVSSKQILPAKRSVAMWQDGSVNCWGDDEPNCFGWMNFFVAWDR